MSARAALAASLCALACAATLSLARAGSLASALTRAYHANPELNSGRAGVRAIDENVPQALSGMRPRVSGDGLLGYERRRNISEQIDVDLNDPTNRTYTQSIQGPRGTPRL